MQVVGRKQLVEHDTGVIEVGCGKVGSRSAGAASNSKGWRDSTGCEKQTKESVGRGRISMDP